jgi:hypothetical protein
VKREEGQERREPSFGKGLVAERGNTLEGRRKPKRATAQASG